MPKEKTKQCSKCKKFLAIPMFIRKKQKRLPDVEEFKLCNNCSEKNKIKSKIYNDKNREMVREKRRISDKKRKDVKRIQQNERNKNKKLQKSCTYPDYECTNIKVNSGVPSGKCAEHNGILHVFKYHRSHMVSHSNRRAKTNPNLTERSSLDLLPTVNDLIIQYKNQNGLCSHCDISLNFGDGNNHPDAISFDRIDCLKSYNIDNTVIACNVCNRSKHCLDISLFDLALKLIFDESFIQLEYYHFVQHPVAKNLSKCFGHLCKSSKSDSRSLTIQEIFNLIHSQNFRCAITGLCLCLCEIKNCPFRPSLDRIDNSIQDHAVLTNDHIVCRFVNHARNSLTIPECLKCFDERKGTYVSKNNNLTTKQFSNEEIQKYLIELDKIKKSKDHVKLVPNKTNEFQPLWDRTITTANQEAKISLDVNVDTQIEFLTDPDFKTKYGHEEFFKQVCFYLGVS